jgi:translation initiation factor IF-3
LPPFQRDRRRPEGPRVNHRIRISPIRVVMEDGTQLGVIPTNEALAKAEELGLDLVEISPTAQPPVCKIIDFGKYKYDLAKKASEAKRNSFQSELKQIRFRPKTEEHDMAFKIKNSREFIEEGHKVQFEVRFRGRENAHPDVGKLVLDRVAKELMDIAKLVSIPRYEGKSMTMIMAPK